jgi:uncharacterized phage protein (TIGR01671 family)
MQRIIKFRAKALFDDNLYSIKKGEFVYGLFYEECIGGEDYNPFEYVHYMKISYGDHFTETPIDEKTIGQFTGLLDKNGKEIYEGDVLNTKRHKETNNWASPMVFKDEYAFPVSFKNGKFCNDLTNEDLLEKIYSIVTHKIEWEVIGNIYENKELLKEIK